MVSLNGHANIDTHPNGYADHTHANPNYTHANPNHTYYHPDHSIHVVGQAECILVYRGYRRYDDGNVVRRSIQHRSQDPLHFPTHSPKRLPRPAT